MAKRGTAKRYSVEHEEFIAKTYGGVRSRSSGAADHDGGDVRTDRNLIECKVKIPRADGTVILPKFIHDLTKVVDEGFAEERTAFVALRYWAPEHKLARDGWIDVIVRPVEDDLSSQW